MISPSSDNYSRGLAKKNVPVASYHDPYYKYYRRALKVALVFVLPVLVLLLVAWLVMGFIGDNFKSQPTPHETYAFDTIPIPASSVSLQSDPVPSGLPILEIENAWLPSYHAESGNSVAYLLNAPVADSMSWAISYYHQKLIDSKQWQLQKTVSFNGLVDIAIPNQPVSVEQKNVQTQQIYVQGIKGYPNGEVLTVLFLDYHLVTAATLKENPGVYGSSAKDGQIFLTITKNLIRRNF